jgi:hypothetical protein
MPRQRNEKKQKNGRTILRNGGLTPAVAVGAAKFHDFVTEFKPGDIAVINRTANHLVQLIPLNEVVEIDRFPQLRWFGLFPAKGRFSTVGTAYLQLEMGARGMADVKLKEFSTVGTAGSFFGSGWAEIISDDLILFWGRVFGYLNQRSIHKRPRCSITRTGTGTNVNTKIINPTRAMIFRPIPSGGNSVRGLG